MSIPLRLCACVVYVSGAVKSQCRSQQGVVMRARPIPDEPSYDDASVAKRDASLLTSQSGAKLCNVFGV